MRIILIAISAVVWSAAIFTATAAEPARVLTETPARVLFIGNSYTYFNDGAYAHLAQLSAAAGHPILTSASFIGGASLKDHWDAGRAQDSIQNGTWDAVVLQSSTFLRGWSLPEFLDYAQRFKTLIDAKGAKTVLFMTWDIYLCPIETTAANYDLAGVQLGVPVVPAGLAWKKCMQDRPALNLYCGDTHHPNPRGTYLNALMFYTAFTRQDPAGLPVTSYYYYDCSDSVSKSPAIPTSEEAAFLQGIAWSILQPHLAVSDRIPAGRTSGIPLTVGPNPAHGPVVFTLPGAPGQVARLGIFDRCGRPVHHIVSPVADRNRALRLQWDGIDVNGRRVTPGMYFYTVTAGARRETGRIVVLP